MCRLLMPSQSRKLCIARHSDATASQPWGWPIQMTGVPVLFLFLHLAATSNSPDESRPCSLRFRYVSDTATICHLAPVAFAFNLPSFSKEQKRGDHWKVWFNLLFQLFTVPVKSKEWRQGAFVACRQVFALWSHKSFESPGWATPQWGPTVFGNRSSAAGFVNCRSEPLAIIFIFFGNSQVNWTLQVNNSVAFFLIFASSVAWQVSFGWIGDHWQSGGQSRTFASGQALGANSRPHGHQRFGNPDS